MGTLHLHLLLHKSFYLAGERVTCTVQVYNDSGLSDNTAHLKELHFASIGQERTDQHWIKALHRSEVSVEAVEQRRNVRTLYRTQPASILQNTSIPPGSARQFRIRFRLPQCLPPAFKGTSCRFTYVVDVKATYTQANTGTTLYESVATANLTVWPPQPSQHLTRSLLTANSNDPQQPDSPFDTTHTPTIDRLASMSISRRALASNNKPESVAGDSVGTQSLGGGLQHSNSLHHPPPTPREQTGIGQQNEVLKPPLINYTLQQNIIVKCKEVPVNYSILEGNMMFEPTRRDTSAGGSRSPSQATLPPTPSPSMLSLVELANGSQGANSRGSEAVAAPSAKEQYRADARLQASHAMRSSYGGMGLQDASDTDDSSSDAGAPGDGVNLTTRLSLSTPSISRQPQSQPLFGHAYTLKVGDHVILRVTLQAPVDSPLQPGASFGGVVDLRPGGLVLPPALVCHQLTVLLESEEVVPAEYVQGRGPASKRSSTGMRKLYCEHQELTSHLAVTQFLFSIPSGCTPSFETPMVALRYTLRFELMIGPPVPVLGLDGYVKTEAYEHIKSSAASLAVVGEHPCLAVRQYAALDRVTACMAHRAECEGEDYDALLEKELAALGSLESGSTLEQLCGPGHSTYIPGALDEDGDELTSCDEDTLQSLQVLQHRFEARDKQCEAYLQELQFTALTLPQAKPQQTLISNEPAESQIQHPLPGTISGCVADNQQATHIDTCNVSKAITALQNIVANSQPDASAATQLPADDVDSLQHAIQTRYAEKAQLQNQQQQDEAERHARTLARLQKERDDNAAAQAAAEAAAAELAALQAATLSALSAAQEQAARDAALLAARQAAELDRIRVDRERTQQRLAEQAAAAQAREAAAQQLQHELNEELAHQFRLRLAVRYITRAWVRYYSSPMRQQKLQLVMVLQCAWRRKAAQSMYKGLKERKQALQALTSAAQSEMPDAIQLAVKAATTAGLTAEEISACIHASQQQAEDVIKALKDAAQNGNVAAFRIALQSAQQLPHLQAETLAASKVFEARKSAAVTALQDAVLNIQMQDVTKCANAATELGADPVLVSAALEQARNRDQQLRLKLMQLAGSPAFTRAAFESLAGRAARLGLQGDVAAANILLNKRRRQVAAQLLIGSSDINYDDAQALAAEARELGMDQQAEELVQEYEKRKETARRALIQAAEFGSPELLRELLLSARQKGITDQEQQEAQLMLAKRQEAARDSLMHAALSTPVTSYRRARRVAIQCGALDCIPAAESLLLQRQREEAAAAVHAAQLAVKQPNLQGTVTINTMTKLLSALHRLLQADIPSLGGQARSTGSCYTQKHRAGASYASLPTSTAVAHKSYQGELSNELADSCLQQLGFPVPADILSQLQPVWRQLVSMRNLGLHLNLDLALGGMQLQLQQLQATDSQQVASVRTILAYDGTPQTAPWAHVALCGGMATADGMLQAEEYDTQSMQLSQPTEEIHDDASSGVQHVQVSDAVVTALALRCERRQQWQGVSCCGEQENGSIWLWPPHPPAELYWHVLSHTQQQLQLPSPTPCNIPGSNNRPKNVRHDTCSHKVEGFNLTKTMLAAVIGVTKPSDVVRLDLGLEKLSSIEGLSQWCPALQVLLLDGNLLETVGDIGKLTSLLKLSVRHNKISDLIDLQGCRELKDLHVDNNSLHQLDGLQHLSQLHNLSAANNMITSLLVSQQPLTTKVPQSVFSACASQLYVLDLSGNDLESLHGLSCCTSLKQLDVSRNQIKSLQGLQACSMLQSIDASNNQLETWPLEVTHFSHLTRLNISTNKIASWGCSVTANTQVTPMPAAATPTHQQQTAGTTSATQSYQACVNALLLPPALEILLIQDNQLSSLPSLVLGPRLTSLNLSFNQLTSVESLHSLGPLQNLQTLQVNDNPLASDPSYQEVIHQALPNLLELDNHAISQAQRLLHMADAVTTSAALALAARKAIRGGTSINLTAAIHTATAARDVRDRIEDEALDSNADTHSSHGKTLQSLQHTSYMLQAVSSRPTPCQHINKHSVTPTAHVNSCNQQHVCSLLYDTVHIHSQEITTASKLFNGQDSNDSRPMQHGPVAVTDNVAAPDTTLLPGTSQLHSRKIFAELASIAGSMQQIRCHSGSRAAAGPHKYGQDDDVQWVRLEHQRQEAMHTLQSQHLQQTNHVLEAIKCNHDSTNTQYMSAQEPVIIIGEGFMSRRLAALSQAACRIQAMWKGWKARQLATHLRSCQYQAMKREAVTMIQAACRAYLTRHNPQLRAARSEYQAKQAAAQLAMEQARKAAEALELSQRTSAAVVLQSAVRGWRVRQHVAMAQQAARHNGDDDLPDLEDDDLLADIESIMHKENIPRPVTPAHAKTLPGASHSSQNPPSQPSIPIQGGMPQYAAPKVEAMMASFPALAKAFAAKQGNQAMVLNAALPTSMAQLNQYTDGSPNSNSLVRQIPHATLPALPTANYFTATLGGITTHESTLQGAERKPGLLTTDNSGHTPISIDNTTTGYDRTDIEVAADLSGNGQGFHSPTESYNGSSVSPGVDSGKAAAAEARQQRHIEKMEALMAEWGFKDIATAEAYWRRQQKQMHGVVRQKLEARFKDPNTRLRKLQEKVEQRPKLRQEDVQRIPAQRSDSHQDAWRVPCASGTIPPLSTNPSEAKLNGAKPPQPAQSGRHVSSADAAVGVPHANPSGKPWQRSSSVGEQVGLGLKPVGGPDTRQLYGRHSNPVGASNSPTLPSLAPQHSAVQGTSEDYGDTMSIHSIQSAASEPARRKGAVPNNSKMPPLLRKSSSTTGDKSAGDESKAGRTAKHLSVVLPRMQMAAPLSNNWVLEPASNTNCVALHAARQTGSTLQTNGHSTPNQT